MKTSPGVQSDCQSPVWLLVSEASDEKKDKKNKKEGFGGLQSRNVIQLYELVFTFLAEWIEQKLLGPNIHMMIHVMAYKLVVFH